MSFVEFKQNFSYPELEKEILDYWEKSDPFHRGLELRKDAPQFSFYEGPPTANGRPGVHHVISRTMKDVFCRYKQMRGFLVQRKAGWDTHGLPVEIEVENQLGLKSKAEIEEYGVAEFNEHCRASVFKYLEEWDALTKRIGYWLDLNKPYITCDNDYIESVWWVLAQFFEKDLIYQGHKILPYCPRCGTGLSSHEVAQGYQEVKDPSIFVKAELVDEPGVKFLVWTTTPWTLLSNVALAVAPAADYVKVQHGEEKLILAEALTEKVLTEEFEILDRFKGSTLEGRKYKPFFTHYEGKYDKIWLVTVANFVTLEDGSGVVHVAPAFGADDYSVGQRYGLPVIQAVAPNGVFKKEVTEYTGKFIKDADPLIIKDLKERGVLFKKEVYQHNYPHCWRCKSPLVYYARKSWYIKTSQFKERLLQRNSEINWVPPEIGSGRMGEWLENNVDWALSRERYWGTPLNIWLCQDCGTMRSCDSVATLKAEATRLPEKFDLHKPYMDEVEFKCAKCGGVMKRTPEVIDCWFDSGSMPYAQFHYPFENKERFEQSFPCDFISEATDQTRGWFYSLLAISTLLCDKPAYKNVVVLGFILDKKGKKMSKSLGNAADPWEICDKFGADAMRWYILTTSQPHQVTRFDADALAETQRKFLDTLRNTYSFFAIYANIDKLWQKAAEQHDGDIEALLVGTAGEPTEIDRWLQSRVASLSRDVVAALDQYDITRAARQIGEFAVDELSNWYVRRCRRRYWSSGDNPDKYRAYLELYRALHAVSRLAAPIIPFFTEKLYLALGGEDSVHLADYPDPDLGCIDEKLEERMNAAIKLVSLGRAARNNVQIKVRQPLAEMRINLPEDVDETNVAPLNDVIAEEINVKSISFIGDTTQVAEYDVVPNFKVLGPKLGADVKVVQKSLQALSESEIREYLAGGELKLAVDGKSYHFDREEVDIRLTGKEGYAVASDGRFTVALVTEISDELRSEGFARELVNKIQNMRKEADFKVTDRIKVSLKTTEPVAAAARAHLGFIQTETLADSVDFDQAMDGFSRDWDINGEAAAIVIVSQ